MLQEKQLSEKESLELITQMINKAKNYRFLLLGLLLLTSLFSYISYDAVTIDDAVYGASQKNVSEVSGWLRENTKDQEGYILISAASHDAIIFSSGLPMKKFIHEGTGAYWDYAVEDPDKWATWIVLRTHDMNDLPKRISIPVFRFSVRSGFKPAVNVECSPAMQILTICGIPTASSMPLRLRTIGQFLIMAA